jgi:hypothetical protein
MVTHKNGKFSKIRVELDDNQAYEDRTFNECAIVYSAKGPVNLTNPNFVNCKFIFEGAAANTVTFLTAIYRVTAGRAGIRY